MGDNGRSNAGNNTRAEGHAQLAAPLEGRQVLPQHSLGDHFRGISLHGELGHGVRNLLQQDGSEAGVEALENSFLLQKPGSSGEKAVGEGRIGNQTDSGGFKRAQEDVGDELSDGRSAEVDSSSVVPRSFFAKGICKLDFEELDSSEFKPSCSSKNKIVAVLSIVKEYNKNLERSILQQLGQVQ